MYMYIMALVLAALEAPGCSRLLMMHRQRDGSASGPFGSAPQILYYFAHYNSTPREESFISSHIIHIFQRIILYYFAHSNSK